MRLYREHSFRPKAYSALFVLFFALTSCMFTGVESTKQVTDKEVQRTIGELERRQPTMTVQPFRDSVPAWRIGKEFYVTDNQLRLIMSRADDDTTTLAGKILRYDGYEAGSVLDNTATLNLKFIAPTGKAYIYRTGKTREQFTHSFIVPLLIDMDMVHDVDRQLRGREVYIKTPLWYDLNDESLRRERQFIKVRIDAVEPGNKVLPLRVRFTTLDKGEQAFVWMSDPNATMPGRDFDSLFSLRDMHENYPDITDVTWQRIIQGQVAVGMTKEECRLAIGAPKRISRLPDQSGLREYWYYDGGSYLFFVDGLLSDYRL